MKYLKLLEEYEPLSKYVTCITRGEAKNMSTVDRNKPLILMPVEFFDGLIGACNAQREIRGVLIVPKIPRRDGELRVLSVLTTGYGSSGRTGVDDNKLKAINKLLAERNDVGIIEFHTHTTGTIRDYGQYFTDHFSSGENGDFGTLSKNVNRYGSAYKHVLFTPTHILTFGLTNPQFRIVKFRNTDPSDDFQYWKNLFDIKMNEDVSATGSPSGSLTGGEVCSMPNSMNQSLGPNSIGNNVGSINMNNTDISDINLDNKETYKPKKKRKNKHKENLLKIKEMPVMNWDEYVKNKYK